MLLDLIQPCLAGFIELQGTKLSVGAQAVALFLGCATTLFGIAAVYSVLYPGPSGEWTGVSVVVCYLVNVPIGFLVLGVGLFVKGGNARLRGPCVGLSLFVLSLPVLANLVFWFHTHRGW